MSALLLPFGECLRLWVVVPVGCCTYGLLCLGLQRFLNLRFPTASALQSTSTAFPEQQTTRLRIASGAKHEMRTPSTHHCGIQQCCLLPV